MYQQGNLIIYSCYGVCRVAEIGKLDLPHVNKERLYYTLIPLYGSGHIYIPVDTDVFMRPILSRADAERLIQSLPQVPEIDCRSQKPAVLKKLYEEYLKKNDCEMSVRLIKGIYAKKQADKKIGQTDDAYMKRAEALLYGELAAALGIPVDEVLPYIKRTLTGTKAIKA